MSVSVSVRLSLFNLCSRPYCLQHDSSLTCPKAMESTPELAHSTVNWLTPFPGMNKTTEDTPTEDFVGENNNNVSFDLTLSSTGTSSEEPVSLVDDQYLSNERQSSSSVSIGTECTASRSMEAFGDQTFSYAAILKESFSRTEDALRKSQFSSGVSDKIETALNVDCTGQTLFASESEKPVSTVDSLNESQSSSVNTKPLPSTTSYSIDISTIDETISLVNDVAERSHPASGLDRKNKISPSTEQFKQPPRKKIKLSRSIKVLVKDMLSGVHTSLCKRDCTYKHNPLVLAVCVSEDHELKDYLENHWKLVMKGAWKSAGYFLAPKSMKHWMHHLVHLTVLFGKCNLLEFLLKICLDCSELYVDSAQNSPLHTVLKCMHHYMPSSSHHEKLMTFQHILHLLAKYNCSTLLVRDKPNEDTILHVCAKKIRELTNQIQSIESLAHDELKLQGLLNQRQLLEGIFKEVIHSLKRLCADGSLPYNQVIELFDCVNNAGETMSQILHDDESARNGNGIVANQVASTLHEEGDMECAKQQTKVAEENVMTEEDISQLSTVTKSSGTCTAQNENAYALPQAVNPFGTVTFCSNHSSVPTTESASMRSTQTVASTLTGNSTGTFTLSTNHPSVQLPTGCSNQSSLTTVSASLWPAQTVVATQAGNSLGAAILSTECQSVQAPNGCPKQSASTTVSVSVGLPQTVVSTQVANPLGSTILLTNRSSGQALSGCPKQSTSSTASVSVPSKTVDTGEQVTWTMQVNTVRQQSGIGFFNNFFYHFFLDY